MKALHIYLCALLMGLYAPEALAFVIIPIFRANDGTGGEECYCTATNASLPRLTLAKIVSASLVQVNIFGSRLWELT